MVSFKEKDKIERKTKFVPSLFVIHLQIISFLSDYFIEEFCFRNIT